MNYDETHTIDTCDKCQKEVGINNLKPIPFLYLDKNDKIHKDESIRLKKEYEDDLVKQGIDRYIAKLYADKKIDNGYRQYYCCDECFTIESRRTKI